MALIDKLSAIGNAIRAKTGGTDGLTLDQMAAAIAGIKNNPVIQSLEVTENGTYTAPSGVDGYSPVTVNVAASGGGVELPERKLFCTLTAEMSWKQIIEANPIPLRYEKALYWFLVDGDNAATQGSTTYKWLYIYVDASGTSVDNTNKFIAYSYKNGLDAPNSMDLLNTAYGLAGSYVTTENNAITSVNIGKSYVGAGNSIYLQEIPFDILNCRFDFTELG